jgi:hypothetical protein
MAISLNILKFQDEATTTGNGEEMKIINGENLTLSITGTATSRTVIFEGKGEVGDYVAVRGFNVKTGVLENQTTGTTDEIWIFDVTGFKTFRARVSAISGGNLSVTGKLVG